MKFSKVLVTGGAGFIGSHLVRSLLARGYNLTVLDCLIYGQRGKTIERLEDSNFRFLKGDIRDKEIVKRAMNGIDAVVHLAALIDVASSVHNPLETHDVNVNGTLILLDEAVKAGVRKFLFASSTAVYGEENKLPLKEEYQAKPVSPYATSKAVAEYYCATYKTCYELATVRLRYFNVYGPWHNGNPYSSVITKFMRNALTHKPVVIYGDGKQTRDFIFVEDVVKATILALEKENSAGEILNICTGKPTSINELAEEIRAVTNTDLNIKYKSPRRGDVRANYGDPEKTKKIIGFEAGTSLKEGLKQIAKTYQN